MLLRAHDASERRLAWWLLAPSVALIVLVVIGPLLFALYLSFQDAEPTVGGISMRFVGLANYVHHLVQSDLFWMAVRVTVYFTLVSLGVELILGIAIALVLNERFWGRSVVRAMILLPWAVPTVVNARMWEWIFAGSKFGALNGLMKVLRVFPPTHDQVWLGFDVPFEAVPVLGSLFKWMGVTRALNMIIVADTWKVTPLVAFLVLAGLQTIPSSLYEAATVDGAGFWRKLTHITLPLLKPVLLVILVLRTMELFRVFDIIYIIMQYSIRVLGVLTYEVGMKFLHFGSGAALSFLVALFILGLALVYIRLFYTEDGY
ncbi:MAG: sugar ABC transporter permease [Firmicutes bacterium]|nr:sugar ABC transporter permease [Bacillota bacterium]MDH7495570.1 sugar ABC transporter permease [Bacillota bacterium]